jgi:dCTP deaminase
VLRWLERRQKLTDAAILVAVILNALTLFLVGSNLLGGVLSVLGNLVASLIVGFIVLYSKWGQKG